MLKGIKNEKNEVSRRDGKGERDKKKLKCFVFKCDIILTILLLSVNFFMCVLFHSFLLRCTYNFVHCKCLTIGTYQGMETF